MVYKTILAIRKYSERLFDYVVVKGPRSFDVIKAYYHHEYLGKSVQKKLNKIILSNRHNKSADILIVLQNEFKRKAGKTSRDLFSILEFLSESITKEHNDRTKFEGEIDEIGFREKYKVQPSALDDYQWKALQYIATANGLYLLGYYYRNLYLDRVLQTDYTLCNSWKSLINIYLAAIDKGHIELAQNIVDRMANLQKNNKVMDSIRTHFLILTGQHQEAIKISEKYYSKEDQLFSNYIKGKRIAIVGPAPDDESVADEVDQFDVVIRTNYRGKEKMPPTKEFGSKINISYYSFTYSNQIQNQKNDHRFAFLNDIQFFVTKNKYSINKLRKHSSSCTFRTMYSLKPFIISGQAQMIQNILFDVLHFDVKEVKLFKSNFFLSSTPYHQAYLTPGHIQIYNTNHWKDHATHDLLTQINFTRSLWRTNIVLADRKANSVLKKTNAEYISEIQRLYG